MTDAATVPPVEDILEGFTLSRTQTENVWKIRMGEEDVLLLVDGVATRSGTDKGFLVGFSGAISNVAQKTPPYFAGQRLAESLDVPLLSFSDPTMERDPTLTLGFHAGNDKVPDLPVQMGRVISRFTEALGRSAVLFGGSGGGFAALNTLPHCGEQDSAVVWNPQTAIARYYWPAFRAYVRAAFPDISALHDLDDRACAPALDAAICKTGCATTLDVAVPRGRVFYFQNVSDSHHMTTHMAPFCSGSVLRRVARNGFFLPERQMHLCIGNWGHGHVPLMRDLLIHSFKGMLAGQPALQLQKQLMEMMGPDRLAPALGAANAIDAQNVKLTSTPVAGALEIAVAMQDVPVEGIEYAFYLMSGAERLATRWYRTEAKWQIPIPTQAGLRVRVYIRDAFGCKKSFNLPLVAP